MMGTYRYLRSQDSADFTEDSPSQLRSGPREVLRSEAGSPGPACTVFVVDDHELARRGVIALLSSDPAVTVVGEAASVGEALPAITSARPDVALLDVRLPDGSGIDLCRALAGAAPAVRCLMLTSYDDDEALLAAVRAGARGFLLKELRGRSITTAVRRVARGDYLLDPDAAQRLAAQARAGRSSDPRTAHLTDRECQVLELIGAGLTNRQIGDRLSLTEKTVKNYVSGLLAKLHMARRSQAAVLGASVGPAAGHTSGR